MTLEDFLRSLMETHHVWARKYAGIEGVEPGFFVIALPKGVVAGQGLVRSIAGDVGASLVEASRGE